MGNAELTANFRAAMKITKKIYTINKLQNESHVAAPLVERSFHSSLRWVLVLAQCFGQMPVCGVANADPRCLKFRWMSWRVLYWTLNCIGSGFLSSFYIYTTLIVGVDLFQFNTIAFHLNTFIITLLFFKLAREWPRLIHKWSSVEFAMRSYGWPHHLHTRITILSIVVLLTAAVEFTLTKGRKLALSIKCKREDQNLMEYFFIVHLYPDVLRTLSYAVWKGVLLLLINTLNTFVWTFNDLFIMLISTALALRFKQVTTRLRLLKKTAKANNISVWRETREDYDRLSKLTRSIDDALSYIILISFAGNLFFILIQLFHSLREMKDTVEKVYFFFSFAFLILRTVCVSLYGAWIYDESREPMATLNSISSEVYNIEIKRLIEQIKFDAIALTGKNFFNVTRGLVLSMAGAVVTYELVLIQFNENLLKESAKEARNSTGMC